MGDSGDMMVNTVHSAIFWHLRKKDFMTSTTLICLVAVFFITAVIGVMTGGTSLITVPVLILTPRIDGVL